MGKYITTALMLVLAAASFAEGEWTSLFNGKDLDGWIVKVNKSPVGENPGDLFRVEEGLLTVSYDQYETFDKDFGHIHTENAYTNYRVRLEYRFTGEQLPGAPGWAFANSGIMIHCPPPAEMGLEQSFPSSAEFQLLGVNRTTGSLFTPGCMVTYKDQPDMQKSIKSDVPSLPLNEWVKAEAVVKDGTIQHWINGALVMEYSNPRLLDGTPMVGGHISLQAESHPCQFRNIEVQVLD